MCTTTRPTVSQSQALGQGYTKTGTQCVPLPGPLCPSPRLWGRVTQIDWDTTCTTTRPTVYHYQALRQGYTTRLGHNVYHYQ